MLIVADTHVHVYPDSRIGDTFRSGMENLLGLATSYRAQERSTTAAEGQKNTGTNSDGMASVAFMAESFGCHYFCSLRERDRLPSVPSYAILATDDDEAVTIHKEGFPPLILVAGRQITTREGLEVLALTVASQMADGKPIVEVISAVRAAGGIPVLSWAPGKWTFGRGRIVAELIEKGTPGEFLIGDTTLRPALMAEPSLMRRARHRGFKIVAGSDPLPIGGEETLVGSYGIACEAELDAQRPVSPLRRMLLDPSVPVAVLGDRSGLGRVLSRLVRHRVKGMAR